MENFMVKESINGKMDLLMKDTMLMERSKGKAPLLMLQKKCTKEIGLTANKKERELFIISMVMCIKRGIGRQE